MAQKPLKTKDQDNKKIQSTAPASPVITSPEEVGRFMALSGDAMLVIDRTGNILRVNEVFYNIFGFDQSEIQTLNFISLFDEAEHPSIQNTLLMLNSAEGTHSTFETLTRTKNQEPRWIKWRLYQTGAFIYATSQDITEMRTQQEALKRREKQLLEAESIGRMGNWRWEIGQENFDWSPEIFRMFGLEEGSMQPTLFGLNEMILREDVDRVNQLFQRAIIQEKDYEMEFRIHHPTSGDTRFIRCEGRCEKDETGEVIALYGIMQDMTERMLHERQLREAKDVAERAYAAKTQFLANMSHELRTPLNAIIGFSEMMQRQLLGPIGTEKYLEYIAGIRDSGEHLLDLISDILDMSKIEAGKYDLDFEEVNVQKALSMAVHMMEGRAMEADVKLVNTLAEETEPLKIVADRRAFMQILLNLMSNAVKFSEEKDTVRIETYRRENYLAIKIIDEGIGIPANKIAQITQPFEQASSSYTRDHEGTGLGLAITKELIEMHGGAMHIDSTYGEGTTVTVRLPYDAFKATDKKIS